MTEKKTLLRRIHDAFLWEDGKLWHNRENRERRLLTLKEEAKTG